MASISKYKDKNGNLHYKVRIRRGELEIYKSFSKEEDAKLYVFYKENLIENMNNFDVPLKNRVTLNHIIDLKINSIKQIDKREMCNFNVSRESFNSVFGPDKFLCELSLDDWLNAAKTIYRKDVYLGAVNEKNKRQMSVKTLKQRFAYASSAFSYAQTQGIPLENYPIKIIQSYISQLQRNESLNR